MVGHVCLSFFLQANKFDTHLKKKWVPRTPSFNICMRYRSKGFAKASITSNNRSTVAMIKSMTKATISLTLKQQVMALTVQSRKNQNLSSNLPSDGVNKITRVPNLKLNSITIFNMRKTLSPGIDEFQAYIDPCFSLLVQRMITIVVVILHQHLQRIHLSLNQRLNPLTMLPCH